ncbi:plasmodesmata-located protein 6-like [Impatiens glandulifera]|uniref:plasmodesmata-located protein 6-like n=1 Tax=Impatiens glandulifera TaxID=253017 RepID=UPI001FB08CB8|nr:plasmodesmata-located protein 6-like [Impatiens glandulifera]
MALLLHPSLLIHLITAVFSLAISSSTSSVDSFVYGGCSSQKYSEIIKFNYESNVKSFLDNIVYSSSFTLFNKFTISKPGSDPTATVSGLFQCRGDLTNLNCRNCVARSVAELGTLCPGSTGAALQLEGCLVKYDNVSFFGVEDKDVTTHKCGPVIHDSGDYSDDSDRESALSYLGTGQQFFRVIDYGNVKGMAQCVQDLSVDQCQDCISEAIRRLKIECPSSASGDMFLVKCYVRFYDSGARRYSNNDDDNDDEDEVQKTIALLVGLIAGVAFLIVFISALSKFFEKKGSK